MTNYYSEFMKTHMASGYDWTNKQMVLVLLHQAVAVGPNTPNDVTALLNSSGWQEVLTVASPTYTRDSQTVGPSVSGTVTSVIYGRDYVPIPPAPTAVPVYVAAGLWYVVDTVGGVVNPWVMISDDMFGSILGPGVRIGGAPPRYLFSYVIRGSSVDISPASIVQSPGAQGWESARIQHVWMIPQRINYIPNPSFEDVGLYGWRSDGTMSIHTPGVDKAHNHFMNTTGTALQSLPVPIAPVFRFSAWVRSAGAQAVALTMWYLDDTYTVVFRDTSPMRPLYNDWIRYDEMLWTPEDVIAAIPTIQADGSFDADLCLLEATQALNFYYDGDSNTGIPGDFSWQGPESQSYSFWYNNRYVTAARLFGEYVTGQITKPSLVFDWLPTGTSVYTHWDVTSPQDTQHPLDDFSSPIMPSLDPPLVWGDDFERANGAIGPNWILGKGTAAGTGGPVPLVIDTGAAIASFTNTAAAPASRQSVMYWAAPQGRNQSIEVEMAAVWGTANQGFVQLYAQANSTNFACHMVQVSFMNGPPPYLDISAYLVAADGTWATPLPQVNWPHAATEPVRIRYESDADGTNRVYVENVLALTWVWNLPASGPYVGMGLDPSFVS